MVSLLVDLIYGDFMKLNNLFGVVLGWLACFQQLPSSRLKGIKHISAEGHKTLHHAIDFLRNVYEIQRRRDGKGGRNKYGH